MITDLVNGKLLPLKSIIVDSLVVLGPTGRPQLSFLFYDVASPTPNAQLHINFVKINPDITNLTYNACTTTHAQYNIP